jgi:hypothetical protein
MDEFYEIKFPDRDSLIKEVERLKHENYNLKKEYRKLEEEKGLTQRIAYMVMYGDSYSDLIFINIDKLKEFINFENENDTHENTWYKEITIIDNI